MILILAMGYDWLVMVLVIGLVMMVLVMMVVSWLFTNVFCQVRTSHCGNTELSNVWVKFSNCSSPESALIYFCIYHIILYNLRLFSYIFQTAVFLKVHLYMLQFCNFISTPTHNLKSTITKQSIPLQLPLGTPKRKKAHNATKFFSFNCTI